MTKGLKVGYIRVSTPDQNPDRQLEGIELDKKFIDYASAKNMIRKELDSMMSYIREGDHVIVHSIDRIARNLLDLRNLIIAIHKKGVSIEFKKENLIFSPNKDDALSNLTLNMMGAFAEFELAIITERRREGMAIARAKGKYKRDTKLSLEQQREIKEQLANHAKAAELAKKHNVSRPTIYACRKVV